MNQPTLFAEKNKGRTLLENISPDECVISHFNVRATRPLEDVDKLAERIQQNGFELTRAPWAYYNDAGDLEVFAGGTRLEAAKKAGVKIPVILFEGCTEEELVHLADRDNENDEYHVEVPIVDVWAHYAFLSEQMGWTQQQIADAKGIGQSLVSKRLKLYGLSDKIKGFIHQKLLNEAQLIEITQLFIDEYLSPWLTTEEAWSELTGWAVGHNTRQTKEEVDRWKKFIELAEQTREKLKKERTLYDFSGEKPEPYDYDEGEAFVGELADRKARTQAKVKEAKREIVLFVKNNLKEYEVWVREETEEAARRAIQAEKEKELLAKFQQGDCLDQNTIDQLQNESVRLLLVDPPYGKDFQSNRRVKSPKAPKLIGDSPDEAMGLFSAMLEAYKPKLQKEVHILSFCDWQSEPGFRKALEGVGFILRGSLVWVKENHSSGDLAGSFAPKHERILHATMGRPAVDPRIDDVLTFPRNLESEHPTAKPVPMLEKLILSCTNEGDLVIDPMAGCASTLLAAWNEKREFWGCEIDKQWHDLGCERLIQKLEENE